MFSVGDICIGRNGYILSRRLQNHSDDRVTIDSWMYWTVYRCKRVVSIDISVNVSVVYDAYLRISKKGS